MCHLAASSLLCGLTEARVPENQKFCFSFTPGLSEKSSLWSYRELKRSLDMVRARPGEFSVCFTELQEKFFSTYPSKLKDLILLVKHWFQKVNFKLCVYCYRSSVSLWDDSSWVKCQYKNVKNDGTGSQEAACSARDPGSGSPPGGGNPLWYFWLEDPMDRGALSHVRLFATP